LRFWWHGGRTPDKGNVTYLPQDCHVQEMTSADGAMFLTISLPMVRVIEAQNKEGASARTA
jgi:hypothetical protein